VPFLTLFPSIMLPMFLGIMDQTIVATALPVIAASLGEVERIAWVVVAYLISTAIMAPVYGRLGDAFGRRKMMMVALGVAIAGSALCALANSMEMLILSRFAQGMGGGGLLSLSQALIGQSVPPRDRARYQGFLATVAVIASTVGPVVGGFLTQHFGWRSIFFLNIPLCLLAMVLVQRLPARLTPFEKFRFDFPGLVLLGIFISCLLVFVEGIRNPAETNWPVSLGFAASAVISVILLIWRERRASSPLLPLQLLKNPNIWRSDALAMMHGGLFVSLISFIPIYLSMVRGASTSEIGLLILPMTAGVGIGSTIVGQIVARTGRTTLFPSIGMMVVTLLILGMAFMAGWFSDIGFSAYLGLISIFMGSVMGVVQVTVQAEAGRLLGTAAASVQLARSLGAAMGTAIVGIVMFTGILATGTAISGDLLAILQGSDEALARLGSAAEAAIRANVAVAFHGVFLTMAIFAAISCALAWSIPRRRL